MNKGYQNIDNKYCALKDTLIRKINAGGWWHVTPEDPDAYKKRGKFLASTHLQAEFYGRPKIDPEKVEIKNPVFGFSLEEILNKLSISCDLNKMEDSVNFYRLRIALDAKKYRRAKSLGYDSIVIMDSHGKTALQKGWKPKWIELNIFL
jgi:hypothetical protein